jgi:hypothetical protein
VQEAAAAVARNVLVPVCNAVVDAIRVVAPIEAPGQFMRLLQRHRLVVVESAVTFSIPGLRHIVYDYLQHNLNFGTHQPHPANVPILLGPAS